ncbi:MAG: aminotransferase class III-fold pyridoxal phosphate-dependent enzyme [Bacteroidales bacterium]|jgi:acetylornithine/succinyldiaminopimelate/putrescine aminotransferase|nr:aminotransferase class III-fold pyridoxal phosphate-dependent enzyme [Bacteroidales bacterium]
MTSLLEKFHRYVAQTSHEPLDIEIARAEGVYIYDTAGKSYIDLISGISVCNMGHSHPAIVQAVQAQAAQYMHVMVYGEVIQSPQVELAALLCRYLPEQLSSIFFVNSGSEAVEGGLKLAKRVTGRREIIHCINAYHGSTHGALSVMGCNSYRKAFQPLLPGTRAIRFGNIDDLQNITEKTAAFIIEPVQGENGVRTASETYWQAVRRQCDKTGAMLILDEIQTGMGRTGKLFAFEHYGIIPDILLLAKAFGGGLPLGAFISSPQNMDSLTHNPALGHITTFGGHPVSCAAALAHLQLITENRLWEQAEPAGKALEVLFRKMPGVKAVRRMGLMMAVEFGDTNANFSMCKKFINAGLFIDWFLFCPTSMRIVPALIMTHEDIETIKARINLALTEYKK